MPLDVTALLGASEGLLASAALGGSWEANLEELARVTGSHSAAMWRSQSSRPSFVGNRVFAEGVAHLRKPGHPPYSDALLRLNPCGQTFVTTALPVIGEGLRRMCFYNEVMVPIGFRAYASLTLDPDDGSFLRFVLYRENAERCFSDEEVRTLDRIAGNVRFATLFARRNAELLVQRRAASFLDRMEPTFTLDRRARAAAMNASADRPGAASPLAIRCGRLVARTDHDTRRVDRIVGEAVGDARRPGSMVFATPAGERHQLLVMPLHGAALDVFTSHRAIAVLARIDDRRDAELDGEPARFLADAFGLTRRETSVALLGADGLPSKAIAAKMGIGDGTARNHLKAVFRKVGVHSQASLAALVARYR